MPPVLKNFWEGLLDFVFPRNCLCCHRYNPYLKHSPICPNCLSTVEFNAPPFCLCCSRRISDLSAGGICPTCCRHEIHFDSAWAACTFNPVMRELIHAFKYRHKTVLRKTFATLILDFLQQYKIPLAEYDTLIPIPLYSARLRERGFNQAELIAQALSRSLQIPVDHKTLLRHRPTSTQTQLSSKERFTNLKGAFRIRHLQAVKGKNILLVDDLLTTGATASEAARALKEVGAASVGVLTVAIT